MFSNKNPTDLDYERWEDHVTLLVMEDGETWGGWENATIIEVTEDTYHQLCNGVTPKQLPDEAILREWLVTIPEEGGE